MSNAVESYMPLWIADYLADTTHLTTAQHGAYLLLLMAYWRKGGPLPDNPARLAAIANMSAAEWRKARPVLAEFFQIEAGEWRQKRADAEIERANAIHKRKAEAGAKGAKTRWQKDSTAIAQPLAKPLAEPIANGSLQDGISPSPSESKKGSEVVRTTSGAGAPRLDEQIWGVGLAYLESNGVKNARSLLGKWRRDHTEAALLGALMDAQKCAVSEPVAWITKALGKAKRTNGEPAEERRFSSTGIPYVRDATTGEWVQDIGLG